MDKELVSAINSLVADIHSGNRNKGFWPPDGRNFGECLMLVITELSEALEAHRSGRPEADWRRYDRMRADPVYVDSPAHITQAFEADIKDSVGDELADAVIRLMDLCGGFGYDLGKHMAAKLYYNSTRPPKHGKNY